MNIKWKKVIICLLIWLTTEIWLNFVGLDDLADYSEFLFERCHVNNVAVICVAYQSDNYV